MRNLTLLLLSILLALAGCGDPLKGQIAQQTPITEKRIEKLGDDLVQGKVRNASLIIQYANRLRKSHPELSALIDQFEQDAGKQGRMYLSLLDRLNTVKNQASMFANSQAIFDELINIYQAADPILYSDALSDPLNVLADMSDGVLPRVNSLSKTQSLKANNAQDFGTGEQLIGNPSYGQWSTGSNGMSFWAWYGMYSMMGDVFGSRRVNYNDWGRNRNYSYYNDYGRTRYSSPDQLRKQSQVDTRAKKSFEQKGQRYSSPYSKSKVGSSSLSGQSKTAQTSAKRFNTASTNRSNYAKRSSSGKSASFRNSKNTTSRSFRRGK